MPIEYNLLPHGALKLGRGACDIRGTGNDIANQHASIFRIGNSLDVRIRHIVKGLTARIFRCGKKMQTISSCDPFQVSVGDEVQFGNSPNNRFRIVQIEDSPPPSPPPPLPSPPIVQEASRINERRKSMHHGNQEQQQQQQQVCF